MAIKRNEAVSEVVELTDVRVRCVGNDRWAVELVAVRAAPVVKTLEASVGLALALRTAKEWRARSNPIARGFDAKDLDRERARWVSTLPAEEQAVWLPRLPEAVRPKAK